MVAPLGESWVLAGAAIAGVVVWIAKLSGAFDGLSSVWNGFSRDFSDSFGAISNALAKGDIQAAWNVVTAFLKTEWVRVTNFLAEAWGNFTDYLSQVLNQYAPWVQTVVKGISTAWDWLWDGLKSGFKWLSDAWHTICKTLYETFKPVVQWIGAQWDKILDKIANAQQAHEQAGLHTTHYLSSEDAVRRGAAMQGLNAEQTEAAVRKWKAEGHHGEAVDEISPITGAQARREDEKQIAAMEKAELEERKRNRALDAATRLQAAQIALKQAMDAANVPGANLPGGPHGNQAFTASQQSAVMGTFSGAVAALLGGGGDPAVNIAKEQLDNEKQWREEAAAQAPANSRAWRGFRPALLAFGRVA